MPVFIYAVKNILGRFATPAGATMYNGLKDYAQYKSKRSYMIRSIGMWCLGLFLVLLTVFRCALSCPKSNGQAAHIVGCLHWDGHTCGVVLV
jgi:hypothetical protein